MILMYYKQMCSLYIIIKDGIRWHVASFIISQQCLILDPVESIYIRFITSVLLLIIPSFITNCKFAVHANVIKCKAITHITCAGSLRESASLSFCRYMQQLALMTIIYRIFPSCTCEPGSIMHRARENIRIIILLPLTLVLILLVTLLVAISNAGAYPYLFVLN